MKYLIDLFPLAAFVIAYQARGIYVATAVLVVSLYLALGLDWLRTKKLNKMLLIMALVATVLGALTIGLRDPAFIKLKPTIVYGLLALACAGSHFIGREVMIQRMMESAIALPDAIWRRLNWAWAGFFTFVAALNYYVAHAYSEADWVHFKFIGLTVLPVVFALAQAPFLARHLQEPTPPESP